MGVGGTKQKSFKYQVCEFPRPKSVAICTQCKIQNYIQKFESASILLQNTIANQKKVKCQNSEFEKFNIEMEIMKRKKFRFKIT